MLHDEELLQAGMKGKVINTQDIVNSAASAGEKKVSFDEEAISDDVVEDEYLEEESRPNKSPNNNKLVFVEQIYSEPVEEFDVAFKDDLVKMKEMGLPLGFLNVSPFEVEEKDGVVEVAANNNNVRSSRRRKKRKKVIDDETRQEFDNGKY